MEVSNYRVEENDYLINYIVGSKQILFDMREVPVLPLFSKQVIDFLSKL